MTNYTASYGFSLDTGVVDTFVEGDAHQLMEGILGKMLNSICESLDNPDEYQWSGLISFKREDTDDGQTKFVGKANLIHVEE